MFQVLILNIHPEKSDHVIYEGPSSSVVLPGADGEFEILDFHKPIISTLKKGYIVIDNAKEIPITGGIAKMHLQSLVAMVET